MRTISSYLLYASLAVIITCSGCKKWLDVQPEDQISDTDLFKDADGFRNALNGVYQQISGQHLYGRQLTWGLASAIGQDYNENRVNGEMYNLMSFDYEQSNTREAISFVWSTAYNAIANCNKIISEISLKDTSFFPLLSVEKNLILGEAKAVRALLHFELLRLFAPTPVNNSGKRAIPYQTRYPAYITSPTTMGAVMDSVIKDLEEAQVLVARNDTLINRSTMNTRLQSLLTGGSPSQGGIFFNYRMHRLNYVAIQGLLARAYLYKGDRQNALAKSEYLYKQFGPAGRLRWWVFTPEWEVSGENKSHKFVDDVILAFYDPELIRKTNEFKAPNDFGLAPETSVWFPPSERDYRANLINGNNVSEKWLENLSTWQYKPQQNTIMPALRLSEIYYIYSECLFEAGRTTEALKVLNEIRYARGKTFPFAGTTPTDFYTELFNEFRREFIVEGQTVFQYKRLNRPVEVGTRRIDMDERFVLPIPEGEINF